MAYLMGSGFEEADAAQAEYESQALTTAFQQFSTGDMIGAAATLGPTGLVAAGLVTTGVGAALGVALAVGLALTKLIGRGRNEADIITPIQNQLVNPQGTGQLDQITQMFVRNPTMQGLQALYDQVQRIGAAWLEFLSDPAFNDGRASQQAADTIMPYINGSCGYHWPPPLKPSQSNCIQWGDGTPGGPGTDGMLGALARAIIRAGGTVPPPLITQGYGSSIATLGPSGSQNFPFIPQAGTIPANAPLSPLRPSSVPVISAGIGFDISTVLLVGAGLYLLQKRRG
jgi:hypothetical protein